MNLFLHKQDFVLDAEWNQLELQPTMASHSVMGLVAQ